MAENGTCLGIIYEGKLLYTAKRRTLYLMPLAGWVPMFPSHSRMMFFATHQRRSTGYFVLADSSLSPSSIDPEINPLDAVLFKGMNSSISLIMVRLAWIRHHPSIGTDRLPAFATESRDTRSLHPSNAIGNHFGSGHDILPLV